MIAVDIARDPLTLRLTGEDHQRLADALSSAYPTPGALDRMLVARLEQTLAAITAPYPMAEATFNVVTHFKARGHLLRLVGAARASQPDNPQLAFFAEGFGLAAATRPVATLEKLIRSTSVPFPVALWRERLARRERCVCRVEMSLDGQISYGTGFLVGPDLVLTNHHVLARAIGGRDGRAVRSSVVCRFDYKEALSTTVVLNPGIEVKLADEWLLDSSPHSAADLDPAVGGLPARDELDYALIRLDSRVGDMPIPWGAEPEAGSTPRGWIEFPDRDWIFEKHQSLFIIQHPKAGPMQLSLDADATLVPNANGTRVRYQTGTEPGSSGSPCFNRFWNIVALHHGADPTYPQFDPRGWNQGIPMRRIAERLEARGLGGELTLADPNAWH